MSQTPPHEIHRSDHYGADYFDWQRESGSFGGWANVDKYRNTIFPTAAVLDFGCGGGFLVSSLECSERYGIEPNPSAREMAKSNGVSVFASAKEAIEALGPETLDVIISDNALEHSIEPWRELQALLPLLKTGGKLHIVVPCENISWKYDPEDVNQHLYSWSPQSFGNLLKVAGFDVVYSRPYVHKWPPASRQIAKFGRVVFNFCARIWGQVDRRWFQIEALAIKPAAGTKLRQ